MTIRHKLTARNKRENFMGHKLRQNFRH